jgi:hypothetical protein
MSSDDYAAFLDTWILDPTTCDYGQGEPPRAGRHEISEHDGTLHFGMAWTDHEGVEHEAEFSGIPDGVPRPFPGGVLADALSVTAVSPRELNSSAFFRGVERMVAQRQLDDSRQAMRVTQVVRLPDGTRPANVSIYRRRVAN